MKNILLIPHLLLLLTLSFSYTLQGPWYVTVDQLTSEAAEKKQIIFDFHKDIEGNDIVNKLTVIGCSNTTFTYSISDDEINFVYHYTIPSQTDCNEEVLKIREEMQKVYYTVTISNNLFLVSPSGSTVFKLYKKKEEKRDNLGGVWNVFELDEKPSNVNIRVNESSVEFCEGNVDIFYQISKQNDVRFVINSVKKCAQNVLLTMLYRARFYRKYGNQVYYFYDHQYNIIAKWRFIQAYPQLQTSQEPTNSNIQSAEQTIQNIQNATTQKQNKAQIKQISQSQQIKQEKKTNESNEIKNEQQLMNKQMKQQSNKDKEVTDQKLQISISNQNPQNLQSQIKQQSNKKQKEDKKEQQSKERSTNLSNNQIKSQSSLSQSQQILTAINEGSTVQKEQIASYIDPIDQNLVTSKWFSPLQTDSSKILIITSNRAILYGSCGVYHTSLSFDQPNKDSLPLQNISLKNTSPNCSTQNQKIANALSHTQHVKIRTNQQQLNLILFSKQGKQLFMFTDRIPS